MTELQGHDRPHAWPTPRRTSSSRRHPGDDAPNVVIVLIDDLGFAQFGCYGSDIDTPNVDALCAGGVQFTQLPRHAAVLAHPRCAPHRPFAARRRHARRVELAHRLPEPTRPHLERRSRPSPRCSAAEGYATFCAGKWHLAPTQDIVGGGPVRPLAGAARLRPVLRLPRGGDRPVPPRAGAGQHPRRPTRPPPTTATTSARTSSTTCC